MADSSLGPLMPIGARANRKRRISEQAGRALEILGHSIEYLVDEIANVPESLFRGHVEAVQLLMATNRRIYFECPEVPRLKDRILKILCAKCAARGKCCVAPGIWSLRCLVQPWR